MKARATNAGGLQTRRKRRLARQRGTRWNELGANGRFRVSYFLVSAVMPRLLGGAEMGRGLTPAKKR